jgi:hypothetical protein
MSKNDSIYAYTALLAGWSLAETMALLQARADVVGIDSDVPPSTPDSACVPTVRSAAGVVITPAPVCVRVAA